MAIACRRPWYGSLMVKSGGRISTSCPLALTNLDGPNAAGTQPRSWCHG